MIDYNKANDAPILKKEFFARSADKVAPDLIGCCVFTIVDGKRAGGMIVETEAYDDKDPFAHCYPGADAFWRKESKPMFFEPGNAYIYRTGQLHSLNFVCDSKGVGSAVLIRAIVPTFNPKLMYKRRISVKK